MAPEVFTNENYNELVDIYSFGVILTELDTHQLPYYDVVDDAGEPIQTVPLALKISQGECQPSFSLSCPNAIMELGHLCLSYKASNRPSAIQILQKLKSMKYLYDA